MSACVASTVKYNLMRKNSSNILKNIHNYPDEIGIMSDMEKSALILNHKNQRNRERDKSI